MMMLTGFLEELGFSVARPEILYCDNNSADQTLESEYIEWRTPTLATKYHHPRDHIDNKDITVEHIPGEADKLNSDIHTKWLPNPSHLRHTLWMGLYDPETETHDELIETNPATAERGSAASGPGLAE